MEQTVQFTNNKYTHLKGFLSKENCVELTSALQGLVAKGKTHKDEQCPISEAVHGAPVFDQLLVDLLPYFEQVSGKKLYPTYSYARMYATGDELVHHVDREACEISATITLGFNGKQWGIYMGNADKSEANEVLMEVGDAVLYRGMEVYHWRDKFEGNWQAQVFLHYVDADGPHAEWKFDKRGKLNIKDDNPSLYYVYNDVLTPSACDMLVKVYSNDLVPKEAPYIGGGEGIIDRSVRDVQRVQLPVYKDLGSRLAAVGLDANHNVWNFNITHAQQSEFLMYPEGGHYKAHIDTLMDPKEKNCRKLTVLAFLNDDFVGGRFFIMNGHTKIYPTQTKGTVLVFPSFLAHGVDPVESGVRYSAVAWMVGEFFK